VPEDSFLRFLDFAGIERFPGAPAEVPVTFAVSKNAPLGGVVPAGTQVATTQTKNVDARVFETRRAFFASRARLERVVAVQPAADRAAMLAVPPVPATSAFLESAAAIRVLTDAEPALQDVDHVWYLASEELFGRKDVADVRLDLAISSGAFPTAVTWRKFDKKANVIHFYGSDGLARSIPIKSPEGQEFAGKLKPGDEVEVTYTEALAVTVEPAKAAAPAK